MSLTHYAWALPLAAFTTTLSAAKLLARSQLAEWTADVPNERSLHITPRPRIGGLAIMCVVLPITWLFFGWNFLLALLALTALSLIDDVRGLPPAPRLLLQLCVAAAVAVLEFRGLGIIAVTGLIFLIVWMTNLFNFMDGIDGLAGGMAVAGFASYGLSFLWAGHTAYALAMIAISGAALGFLVLNFPPAKIYMGDAGSVPLGFAAAVFGILGWHIGAWPAWFPVIVFWPFVSDATLTLLKRLFNGKKIWHAHREHYYQRLAMDGGHKRAILLEYCFIIGGCAVALAAWRIGGKMQLMLPVLWATVSIAFFFWIDSGRKRHTKRVKE